MLYNVSFQALKDRTNYLIIILCEDVSAEDLDDDMRLYLKTNTYLSLDNQWFWEKLSYAMPLKPLSVLRDRMNLPMKTWSGLEALAHDQNVRDVVLDLYDSHTHNGHCCQYRKPGDANGKENPGCDAVTSPVDMGDLHEGLVVLDVHNLENSSVNQTVVPKSHTSTLSLDYRKCSDTSTTGLIKNMRDVDWASVTHGWSRYLGYREILHLTELCGSHYSSMCRIPASGAVAFINFVHSSKNEVLVWIPCSTRMQTVKLVDWHQFVGQLGSTYF